MANPSGVSVERPPFFVGNDVVDLAHPRCRDAPLDGRFVERVLADSEREALRAASEPRRTLWRTWAAKEAGYKVVSKRLGEPPPFEHARFVVAHDAARGGTVRYDDLEVPFRMEALAITDVLHVVAWWPAGDVDLRTEAAPLPEGPAPVHRLTVRERRAIHSPASGWVRVLARGRAEGLPDMSGGPVEIVCSAGPPGRTAPRLLVNGGPAPWDVSLSHHGGWVGWALGRRLRAGS
jgi:phosphopantetheine--protein transferase-like protein